MLSVDAEQRINVKLCVKLGKSATETYHLLKKVYGDECLPHTQVFKWFKRFKEGRELIGDDQRPGRPSTSKTEANIEKIGEIVRQNRRLGIRAIAELINIDKETVLQILHNNFNMKKVCSKMVPRLLTPDQKEIRMNICGDILQNIENDPKLFLSTAMFVGRSCSYWQSYLHCQHAPCDGYNPPKLTDLSLPVVHHDNCLISVDRECLSRGTRLFCPSTPQLPSHSWSLLKCHSVSISVSWVLGPRAYPFYVGIFFLGPSYQNRSGEKKKLSVHSLWPNPSTFKYTKSEHV